MMTALNENSTETVESIIKLSKDLKKAAATLKESEVRFLVDAYYQQQADRIRSDARARELSKAGEPHEILNWLGTQSLTLEKQIKSVLDVYVKHHIMGKWLMSIDGIGPVISAGLLAHIDINIANTAGKIWSFAGIASGKLDSKWEKGEKRPWNATLKTLCWKIGESFVKVSNKEGAIYGNMYALKKAQLLAKNEAGGNKQLAEDYLAKYTFGKTTDAYKCYIVGKLPPAHIHAQAKRYAVKMFLSHFQSVWYEKHHGVPAPMPFVIAHLGHVDYIAPPR